MGNRAAGRPLASASRPLLSFGPPGAAGMRAALIRLPVAEARPGCGQAAAPAAFFAAVRGGGGGSGRSRMDLELGAAPAVRVAVRVAEPLSLVLGILRLSRPLSYGVGSESPPAGVGPYRRRLQRSSVPSEWADSES